MAKKRHKEKAHNREESHLLDPHVIFRNPPTGDVLSYMQEYDTADDEPYLYVGELSDGMTSMDLMEKRKIQKVNKEDRDYFYAIWKEHITDYWNRKHLIPQGEEFSKLRRQAIECFANECRYAIKEDATLNGVLKEKMTATINKLLKIENAAVKSGKND